MCDPEVLKKLLPLQVKISDLHCTLDHKCWCNQISFRFPLTQPYEKCFSPKELLEEFGNDLNTDDIKYLKSLLHKKFISQ